MFANTTVPHLCKQIVSIVSVVVETRQLHVRYTLQISSMVCGAVTCQHDKQWDGSHQRANKWALINMDACGIEKHHSNIRPVSTDHSYICGQYWPCLIDSNYSRDIGLDRDQVKSQHKSVSLVPLLLLFIYIVMGKCFERYRREKQMTNVLD